MLNFTNVHKVPFLFKLVHRWLARDFRSLSLISDVIWSSSGGIHPFISSSLFPKRNSFKFSSRRCVGLDIPAVVSKLLHLCGHLRLYPDKTNISQKPRAILVDMLICVPLP